MARAAAGAAVRGHSGPLRRRVRPSRRGDRGDRVGRAAGAGLTRRSSRTAASIPIVGEAARLLAVGIGGGGDVVGALGAAELGRPPGSELVLGGVTWEQRAIDAGPGPRRLDEVQASEPLNDVVVLAGADTHGPGGFAFAESRMAAARGALTALVDPHGGPRAVADGLADAAAQLRCDVVLVVDVGGDALAHGDESGLASPLCDAVMLAAGAHLAEGEVPVCGAIFGPGCDGELTQGEVLERLAELAGAGGLLGVRRLGGDAAHQVEHAATIVPTEASAQALRCAHGEVGTAAIRGGRRQVELTVLGALCFYFEPRAALRSAARLATAVAECADLEAANARLHELGVRTELDLERAGSAG